MLTGVADTATLRWVQPEVERCLQRARGTLEAYAESGAATHLGDCLQAVHQARGGLELVQCHDAGMLLEELEAVLASLAQGVSGNADLAADAVVRAVIKADDYVAWLARGNPPAPLVLLPLFNDLRAARAAPLLSESALFSPGLEPRLRLPRSRRCLSPAARGRLLRRLRVELQRGLLEWYRGTQAAGSGLVRLQRVLATLEQMAGADHLWPVWWVASGVVDSLRRGALADGPAVRRVVGQLDACLRALIGTGEDAGAVALVAPGAPLKNLLYLCTRVAAPASRRIQRVREVYALAPYVPGCAEREHAERSFSGPGADTLSALASALRGEMRELQVALDAWARASDSNPDADALIDALRRFGDCFGLINCGDVRRALHVAAWRLELAHAAGDTETALAAGAEALLHASDSLDGIVCDGLEAAPPGLLGAPPHEQALAEALIVEVYTNLAAVKHLLAAAEEHTASSPQSLHSLVRPAAGALRLFGLQAQAVALERWHELASQVLATHAGTPPAALLAQMAESLLAFERHLGGLVGREPRRESSLAGVERRLRALESAARSTPASAGRPAAVLHPPEQPRPATGTADDADVVAVFLAECDELVEDIRRAAVAWTDDPRDRRSLLELRRAFHTLEGSGRLMGVRKLGALAMAVEQVLGRVVDGTLAPDAGLHDALGEACQLLPRVIVAPGQDATAPPVDALVARLHRLRRAQATEEAGQARTVLVPAAAAGSETQTVRVFVEEAGEILDACDAVMQKLQRSPGDVALINELRREVHTLKGSAHVAGVTALGDLAHAMESALALLADGAAASSLAFLAMMEECLDRFADQLELVRAGRPAAPVQDLVARIDAFVSGAPIEPSVADAPSISLPLVLRATGSDRDDRIQVPIGLLDRLTGLAGELGVTQTQTAEGLSALRASLAEMREAVRRVRTQARRLDRDTRPAALATDDDDEQLQAMQGERAASLRGLARAIAESAEDLHSLWQSLEAYADASGGTVAQQSRAGIDLHNELTRARREPFASYVPRLRRIVRRTLQDMGRVGELSVSGEQVEVDRLLMDRLVPALEHMLRNAVAHGIEPPAQRRAQGKPEQGAIGVSVVRGSGELLIRITDDGAGLRRDAIHRAAVARGLLPSDAPADDPALDDMILRPGFSTASELTRFSGRGLGLDVASSLVRQLGGELRVESQPGRGTQFTLQLPLDTTLKQVLLVRVDESVCALLTSSVAGVLENDALAAAVVPAAPADEVEHESLRYRRMPLAALLAGGRREQRAAGGGPAVLVRAGEERFALMVDSIVGRQELVLSALGPAPAGSQYTIGATILADGRPANVLDVPAVVRAAAAERERVARSVKSSRRHTPLVLVADDSITVRQVTSRLLGREGMEVMTAKDGIETLALLREHVPDVLVLDIEMPRMDGFQVASAVRADARLEYLPIVMVTSRVGPKHSERARALGVDRYLGKPYAEQELVGHIRELLESAPASPARASTGT